MTKPECLEAALYYARKHGWAVFPLNGKRPFSGTAGHTEATTDRKQIKRWWRKWPDANVGIKCDSRVGPIVIDIDGPSGLQLLSTLTLPPTREATSGRPGRRHLYFGATLDATPVPRIIKIKRNGAKFAFDVLGDGGYVVAPPSIHPETGIAYSWSNRRRIQPLPDDVLQLVRTHNKTPSQAPPLPDTIHEGERDQLLTSLAGSMRRRGASEDAILAALREENATRVVPPLDDRDLKRIAKSIAKKAPAGHGENLTDLGNARRFIAQHHDSLRSVGGARRPWYVWDGPRWIPDDTGEVERRAKATVRSLYTEAAHLGDAESREQLLKHAAKSEQASRIRGLLELAATEPEISITSDAFDSNPWAFNVENGTIDLRTGNLQGHQRQDLITKLAPVEFNPKAKAPRWTQFLAEVMAGDLQMIDFLQRAVGYAMTGDTREECLFFMYGKGANGKSKFIEILRELFGSYAQQSDFNSFLSNKGEGPRNDLARMRGARLVTASEADAEKGFDGRIVKLLTGDDTIVARKLYEEFFEFKPQHKLFLAANHKPLVKEQTEGFWRRMRLIPFTVTFAKADRDQQLMSKLRLELPGILNWALEGCLLWQKYGLPEPKSMTKATQGYREENDVLGEFIAHEAKLEPNAWISSTELYRAFSEWWVDTRGPRTAPISMGWFSRMLGERAEITAVKRHQIRGWKGITTKMRTP